MAGVICPCGSGMKYTDCCGRYINGGVAAPAAEALMRSRYTAYTQLNADYLRSTWHPSTRPAALDLAEPTQWIALEVKRHELQDGEHATVEFVARYKVNGRAHRMHELSRFVREAGLWFYLDGKVD